MIFRSTYPNADTEPALFISKRTGCRLTGRRVEQIVAKALKKADLDGQGYSPHKLRHTAATTLYQKGLADILEIKEILGHASISTTQIYCHTAATTMKRALDSMGDVFRSDGGDRHDKKDE